MKHDLKVGDKVLVKDNSMYGDSPMTIESFYEEIKGKPSSASMIEGGAFSLSSLIKLDSVEGQERWEKIKEWVSLKKQEEEMRSKLFGDKY